MRRTNLVVSFVICGLSLIFYLLLPRVGSVSDPIFISRVNATILFATVLAIIWYTIETNRMQQSMRHQLELSVMPLFAVQAKDGEKYEITNIGNGPGLNIRFEPIVIDQPSDTKLVFNNIPCLSPRETREEVLCSKRGDKKIDWSFSANVDQKYAKKDYKMVIFFDDILGIAHKRYITLGKSGLIFLHETR